MTGPVLRARECCGRTWDDPSEETLHDLLADLNLPPGSWSSSGWTGVPAATTPCGSTSTTT